MHILGKKGKQKSKIYANEKVLIRWQLTNQELVQMQNCCEKGYQKKSK